MPAHQPRYKWLKKLLTWVCPSQLLEEVEGDIEERFERDRITLNERQANRRRVWNTLSFIRPEIMLRHKFSINLGTQLIGNNVAMSFRLMNKDRVFTLVNLFGLTVSMTVCLLIFQFAIFEFNYDRGFGQQPNTYRLHTTNYQRGEIVSQTALTSSMIGPSLASEISEITQFTRLYSTRYWFDCALSYHDGNTLKVFNEKHLYYADPSALSMFTYQLLKGDIKSALAEPYGLVMSETAARKYFGEGEAIGKTLRLKGSYGEHDYVVTGIMTNPRSDSHLDADILASISSLERVSGFKFSDSYTYVTLLPGVDQASFMSKLQAAGTELLPPINERTAQLGADPIEDIHLYARLTDEMRASGNVGVLYVLLLAAFVVLGMAWINYANLTIARSFTRAKEVGIRKISGASRAQVTLKFFTEVVVFNVFSLSGAVVACFLFAPSFYAFVNVPVPSNYLLTMKWPQEGRMILAGMLACMMATGLFPAQYLSALNPIRVLKERYLSRAGGFSFTRLAVILQFSFAIAFGIAVLTFNRQFAFVQHQDLGISINKALILRAPADVDSTYHRQLRAFKNDLIGQSLATHAATSSSTPANAIGWTAALSRFPDQATTSEEFLVNVIDPDFISTYDLEVLAGRNFTENDYPGTKFGEKVEAMMLNREGAKLLGFTKPEDAIGEPVFWGFECRVVAVVEDYYQQSLKQAIQPQVFIANNGPMISMKLVEETGDVSKTLQGLNTLWNKYFPNNAFDYNFLEQEFDKQYAQDQQLAHVFNLFCLLALVISCLGLFALSSFSVQERTKEVGVRKVLGASSGQLLRLLTREYVYVIVIAGALAIPLAYWGVEEWLSGFALRISLDIGFFIIPVALVLTAAVLTVAIQTLRLIGRNPTESLRHE